jgi:hypothetical protein
MITGKYLFVFVLLIAVLAVPVYSGIFQQDSGSDGIVSMGAENYSEKAVGSGHASGSSWALMTSPASYSGAGAPGRWKPF